MKEKETWETWLESIENIAIWHEYRGIEGFIKYDQDEEYYVGQTVNLRGNVYFCHVSLEEAEESFREAVDWYLETNLDEERDNEH